MCLSIKHRLKSRKCNRWDNPPSESFFHTLKTELIHHSSYQSNQEYHKTAIVLACLPIRSSVHNARKMYYNRNTRRIGCELPKGPQDYNREFEVLNLRRLLEEMKILRGFCYGCQVNINTTQPYLKKVIELYFIMTR
jgi:hypothetical protein